MPAKHPTTSPIARCIPPWRRLAVVLLASAVMPTFSQELPMKIRLSVNGEAATAVLNQSAAARDFAALLPLALTLEDYAVVERIANLPRKLSLVGAPAGSTPVAGDITYYAPWGNVAIFVGGGNAYAKGLLPLGKVESGLSVLAKNGPLKVRIERIE
jgi:hypothetical protein